MTVRNYPGGASNGRSAGGAGLLGAAAGAKLTITGVAGADSVLIHASVAPTAGAAMIALKVQVTGTSKIILQSTTGFVFSGRIPFLAGQTATIEVMTADAASVFDAMLSVEEYPST